MATTMGTSVATMDRFRHLLRTSNTDNMVVWASSSDSSPAIELEEQDGAAQVVYEARHSRTYRLADLVVRMAVWV